MIIRARSIVTMDGAPIGNGAVAIRENRVVDTGNFHDVRSRNSDRVIDLGERVLFPGLINAHCHLDYTCLRGKIAPPRSFADWVGAINQEKAGLSPDDYVASIESGFAEAKRFGTTTVANLTAFPELVAGVIPPIRTWWFAELIDVRDPTRAAEMVNHAIVSLKRARSSTPEDWGMAPHALFTASGNLFRRCNEAAELSTTHLAESRDEMAMFREAAGPLYEFLKGIGRDMSDCGGKTPVQEFTARIGKESFSRWIVAHLNEVAEDDFDLISKLNSEFHVVHCPRSHKYFEHSPFQYRRLRDSGLNICLGTDSLASNEDLSLFAEMRAFAGAFPDVPAEEVLKMVTLNPARALKQERSLGRICPSAFADLLAVPLDGSDPYEAIVCFSGEPWTMLDGQTAEQ